MTARRAFTGAALGAAASLAAGAAMANTLRPTARPAQGRFAGQTVVITGGNSGIGAATARAFAAEGARVTIAARREEQGRAVEAEIRAAGGDATWVRTDVRDEAQVNTLVEGARARTGRLDVLFNNAGIFMTPNPIEAITTANFADMMATNVNGVFFGMRAAIPVLRAQGGGVIVNMASVAGHRGFANTAHYNASKFAVRGLTQAAASANARHNIRIVSLSPLAVDTPMLRESFAHQNLTFEAMAPNFATPRIMHADEMARAVLFLADPSSSFITGTDLDVTGGQLA
jgi:NAD(P)-dependent dehydrogenase (short-subunit alcohol dehydrogenase family)